MSFVGFLSVDPNLGLADLGVAELFEEKLEPDFNRIGAGAFALGVIAPRLFAKFKPGVRYLGLPADNSNVLGFFLLDERLLLLAPLLLDSSLICARFT